MRSLLEKEGEELLTAARIGRLGCVDNGEPYVVPISYFFEDGSIYSHSLPGRKIDILRSHPRACLQVDDIESDFSWRSAIAYGDFEEVHEPAERNVILRKLLSRFPLLTPVESTMALDASAPDSVVFRLRIDRITGMAEGETDLLVNP
ncbi:MAG TPA: pyridoxamine 5'-phosphate oxidase family protein [Pyrinomonadaceae bacterium]|jgi:nitroimidazol reductase NimA-like FMN-containing flavoprotein (pyridoxamine 5'-phosphate oxidase superfamily)|nr:pyridoxamine 5'-phosphate oxidase family protein [Pyrinomonadaceae bacterium]